MASALASTQWRSEFRRGGQLEKFCYAHTRAAAASYYLFDGDRKADESFSLSCTRAPSDRNTTRRIALALSSRFSQIQRNEPGR